MFFTLPISVQHLQHRLVGASVGGTPETGDAGGDAGERIGARGAGQAYRAGGGVLLMIGVQDHDQVHRT